uniref:hypothetical protein n=1 Tax=Yoonia sp. TaxID=2212373 RepID=UPI0040484C7C
MSSANRGKITSTNSTHPTPQIAKQIQAQRNAKNKRPIAKQFRWGGCRPPQTASQCAMMVILKSIK